MTQSPTPHVRVSSRDFLDGGADIRRVISTIGSPEYRVWGARGRSEEQKDLARKWCFTVFETIPEPTRLAPPIDWHQDPFQSRSWQALLHMLRLLDILFRMHFEDGELGALEQARDIVLDWISQNPRGDPDISEFAWLDKVTGDRAPFFAYLLIAGCQAGILSEDEARSLLRSVLDHAAFLLDDAHYTSQSNHGLFQDAGLLLLGTYFPFLEDTEHWREHALARLRETLARQVGIEEGIHLEHSPAYQYLTIQLLTKIVRMAKVDDDWLQALLKRMTDAGGWFVLPDGTVPPMGDSDPVPAPSWAQEDAHSKEGLRVFPSSGWAVVRDEATRSALVISAGYHGLAHKHPDELTFCLVEGAEPVVVEAGKYGYDTADEGRQYALSSTAHNVLIVDGESFRLKGSKPYGSGIRGAAEADGWCAITGTNELLVQIGVQHSRLFLYRPGFALIVVDEVESADEHTYTRLFHLGPSLEIEAESALLRLRGSSFQGSLCERGTEESERRLVRGRTDPTPLGWTFVEYRKWQEIWTVEYESQARSATFVTTLALQRDPVQAGLRQIDGDTIEVGVEAGSRTFDLIIERGGQDLRLTPTAYSGLT
jgi:Heparinase II/III-like protein/Heparinase II/III N-terminus